MVASEVGRRIDEERAKLREEMTENARAEALLCVVCLGKQKNTLFEPCGHVCCCDECAQTIRNAGGKCPMCRQAIRGAKKAFV